MKSRLVNQQGKAQDAAQKHRQSTTINTKGLDMEDVHAAVNHRDPRAILSLQRMIGNHEVQRLLNGETTVQREGGEGGQSFSVSHTVPLIPQSTGMSCWAASAAMLVGWRDSMSIPDGEIANAAGAFSQYQNGLLPNDRSIFPVWGMVDMPPQSYSITGLREMIESYGPLWFASDVGSPHARVITGIYGDGTPDNTFLRINDPWPPGTGAQYTLTISQMTQQVESLYGQESKDYIDPYYFARLQ